MTDAFADPPVAGAIMHRIVPRVDMAVARDETAAVAECAQVPGKPLGDIDPARIDAPLDVIKGRSSSQRLSPRPTSTRRDS